jgi:hypothetical protein
MNLLFSCSLLVVSRDRVLMLVFEPRRSAFRSLARQLRAQPAIVCNYGIGRRTERTMLDGESVLIKSVDDAMRENRLTELFNP